MKIERLVTFPYFIYAWALLAVWVVFLTDYAIYLFALWGRRNFWKRASRGFLVVLFPLLRLGISTFQNSQIWIPFMGWKTKERALEKQLTRFFSLPMIFVALMVLPILGIEYCRKDWMEHKWVNNLLSLGSQIIWLAFTIEFTLVISVARKKMAYCARHWIDLAIILLPVILFVLPFLSFLPLARLARLSRVMRSTRLLRLKGVGLKAFQALVLFSGTKRFGKNYHAKRLKRLRNLLAEMEEDMEELRQEIAELEAEQQKMNNEE
jgi:voltage-gated potassium channel